MDYLIKNILATFGLTFLVSQSVLTGDYGIGLRTVGRRLGLGRMFDCFFCAGFWCALCVQFAGRDPVELSSLSGAGAITGLVIGVMDFFRNGRKKEVFGWMAFGALAVPAVAAIPMNGIVPFLEFSKDLRYQVSSRITHDFLSALSLSGAAYMLSRIVDKADVTNSADHHT